MLKQFIPPFFLLVAFLSGCSKDLNQNRKPAIFDTRSEAERAAKQFNCSGAHRMGDKWMPCNTHHEHESHTKKDAHGDHHHNH